MTKRTLDQERSGDDFSDRIDVQVFSDWALLSDHEIQGTLRYIHTKDLVIALKDKRKEVRKVERRIMENISKRVQHMTRNEMSESEPTDDEISEVQKGILEKIRRFQILGRIRRPSRLPSESEYETALKEWLGEFLTEARSREDWHPRASDLAHLVPYLACLIQEQGIEGAKEALKNIKDPILQKGLELIGQTTNEAQVIRELEELKKQVIAGTTRDIGLAVQGILLIAGGRSPKEIYELVLG